MVICVHKFHSLTTPDAMTFAFCKRKRIQPWHDSHFESVNNTQNCFFHVQFAFLFLHNTLRRWKLIRAAVFLFALDQITAFQSNILDSPSEHGRYLREPQLHIAVVDTGRLHRRHNRKVPQSTPASAPHTKTNTQPASKPANNDDNRLLRYRLRQVSDGFVAIRWHQRPLLQWNSERELLDIKDHRSAVTDGGGSCEQKAKLPEPSVLCQRL